MSQSLVGRAGHYKDSFPEAGITIIRRARNGHLLRLVAMDEESMRTQIARLLAQPHEHGSTFICKSADQEAWCVVKVDGEGDGLTITLEILWQDDFWTGQLRTHGARYLSTVDGLIDQFDYKAEIARLVAVK